MRVTQSPISHSLLTSFQSAHHVALWWPVECTMIWARFQHLNECKLLDLIAADICTEQETRLPYLHSHKLSIWPPCGTVVTGGMLDDLSLIPAFKCQPHMIAADISHDNEHVSTCFEGSTRNPTVCCSVAMLWLVGQTRWPLFVFFLHKIVVMIWMAQATQMIGTYMAA